MVIVVVQLCEVYKVKILSPKVNKQKCDVVYCKKQPCYHCQGENSINYLTNRPRVERSATHGLFSNGGESLCCLV